MFLWIEFTPGFTGVPIISQKVIVQTTCKTGTHCLVAQLSDTYQMQAKESMLQSKDNEIIHLLNQIASDMVKHSDVDEIVKNAVTEEHDRIVTF